MTTNRIGTMDVAFQSRMQLAIEYPSLTTATRGKIWEMFIKRLEDRDSREELLDDVNNLKKLDLNGRQIRNAMQLAQSMALRGRDELFGEVKKLAPIRSPTSAKPSMRR